MAAAEAADCGKSQLISLPQMHERSHITITARSVTVSIQGQKYETARYICKHLALCVYPAVLISVCADCVWHMLSLCCLSHNVTGAVVCVRVCVVIAHGHIITMWGYVITTVFSA